jgi:hypothetical protein
MKEMEAIMEAILGRDPRAWESCRTHVRNAGCLRLEELRPGDVAPG